MKKSPLTITLVVAAAENNAIGKDNKLLWHLPDDLRFFKNVTWAMPIVMGRKTFESFGKALPGRTNIVITRQKDWSAPDAIVAASWEEALQLAENTDCKEVNIAGGAEIYRMALPFAQQVILTRVHHSFEADTFFPELPADEWEKTSEEFHSADEKHAYAFSFEKWCRNRN